MYVSEHVIHTCYCCSYDLSAGCLSAAIKPASLDRNSVIYNLLNVLATEIVKLLSI